MQFSNKCIAVINNQTMTSLTDRNAKRHIRHWRTPATSLCVLSTTTTTAAADATENFGEQRKISGAAVKRRSRRRLSALVKFGSIRIPTAATAAAATTLVSSAADISGKTNLTINL